MNEHKPDKEERILRVMRRVLIEVIKDTTTMPGLKHPLSERTQDDIRRCLDLITARQGEIAEAAGIEMNERPVFGDQPKKSVVVPLTPPPHKGDSNND